MTDRVVAEHARAGREYVAAPVLGRPDAAKARKLWILVGGPPRAVAQCKHVFEALGTMVPMPDAPRAALTKIIASMMTAGVIELLGEVTTLAEKGGLGDRARRSGPQAVLPASSGALRLVVLELLLLLAIAIRLRRLPRLIAGSPAEQGCASGLGQHHAT